MDYSGVKNDSLRVKVAKVEKRSFGFNAVTGANPGMFAQKKNFLFFFFFFFVI